MTQGDGTYGVTLDEEVLVVSGQTPEELWKG